MRILHGPRNIGGIGGYLMQLERGLGHSSDFVTYFDKTNRYNNSYNYKIDKKFILFWPFIMGYHFFTSLFKYDVFHFYYGWSLLPLGLDLPILRLLRKRIIMTYCGSDTRLIKYVEMKRNPYAHLLRISLDHPKYDIIKIVMMKWHNLWVHYFIAPRQLYHYAAYAIPRRKIIHDIWIHNLGVIDTNEQENHNSKNRVPLILHAPSAVGIKGTKYVEKAIDKLREEGVNFVYKRIEKLPTKEAIRLYQTADIIIDQLLIGCFGNLAIEGMALGKPVITYVIPEVKDEFYPDCPLVSANIENISEKLLFLINNPKKRNEIGEEGKVFVKAHMDPNLIINSLIKYYQ